MQQIVNDALDSAAVAGNETSNDADAKFKRAIGALSAFEKKYFTRESVTRTMAEAEAKDKSSSTILKTLKETFRVRECLDIRSATCCYKLLAVERGTDEDSRVSPPQVTS